MLIVDNVLNQHFGYSPQNQFLTLYSANVGEI